MPSDPYQAEIAKFRQEQEATLKGDTGWLTIGGLWFLTQPQTTFGSDPLNDIVFPPSAPGARRDLRAAQRQGQREGCQKASPFSSMASRSRRGSWRRTCPGPPIARRLASICSSGCTAAAIGCRSVCAIRTARCGKTSPGSSWFPVNPAYRVEAAYTPYEKPKIVDVASIIGDIDKMPIPGIVTFTLNGQEYRARAVRRAGRRASSGSSSAI